MFVRCDRSIGDDHPFESLVFSISRHSLPHFIIRCLIVNSSILIIIVPMDPSPLRCHSSAEIVPNPSVQFLHDLETHARSIACGIDMALRDLRGSLRGMGELTCESAHVFGSAVNSTCDSVDASIRSMYTMMAKTEELNESMRGIEKLLQQIKDTKRLLDLFEERFIVGKTSLRQ